MENPTPRRLIEPRWPPAITIVGVLVLMTLIPDQVKIMPLWFHYIPAMAILAAMTLVAAKKGQAQAIRVERIGILLYCIILGVACLFGLAYLIDEMIYQSKELDGLQLLTSSVALWVNNVLMFSLLYWQVDRGGPEARLNHRKARIDWLFPQDQASEDFKQYWRSTFVDYLFLAYTTATAFSPTDALPLTPRAKLLMMLESSISLVTILVVVSRAINILGS